MLWFLKEVTIRFWDGLMCRYPGGMGVSEDADGAAILCAGRSELTITAMVAVIVKSGESESSFFDGVDTSLIGIASLAHGVPDFSRAGCG